ncbi:MAG: ATP-binding protein [Pirellulaceae bacterium]
MDRASFLAVVVNLVIMFVPVAVARSTVTYWLWNSWQESRLSGAFIAFCVGLPYSIVAIAVPIQFYYSWYPDWMQFFWCMRVFGFSMGLLMLQISRTEQARRISDAKWESLLDQSAVGVAVVDLSQKVLRRANDRFVQLTNLPHNEVGEIPATLVFTDEETCQLAQVRDGKLAGFTSERILRQTEEVEVWGNLTFSSASATGQESPLCIVVLEDATERKEALRILNEHAARLELAIAVGKFGTFIWDLASGEIVWSENQFVLHGFRPGEVKPTYDDCIRRVHPDDLPAVQQELERVKAARTDYIGEYRILWPDKSVHWLQVRGRFFYDDQGSPIRMMGVIANIDDTKRIENELRDSNEQLREALEQLADAQSQAIRQARLGAIGQMAAGIAHDLNNSLSPISAYASLVADNESLSGDTKKWAQLIVTGVHDTAEIVKRLNRFYRQSHNRELLADVNLADLVNETIELTRPRWQHDARANGQQIDVTADIDDQVVVKGDAAQLRAVLTNLIFNAVDAAKDIGTIAIAVKKSPEQVRISVTDSGEGMTPEQLQSCLEPFYTTKSDGSGLGLSECHGIIRQHGGELTVESSPGTGTTITCILPTVQAASVDTSTREEDYPSLTGWSRDIPIHKRRILCIDDEEAVARSTAAILATLHLEVEISLNGSDGLRRLESGHFDLVICDQGLPEMDGLTVLKEIKTRWPHLPVIMVSGWSLPEVQDSLSPDAFLQKPFSLKDLQQAVDRHLATTN